jgi:hypothetical protein
LVQTGRPGDVRYVALPAFFSGMLDDLLSGFTPEESGFLKSMLKRVLANADNPLS